MLFSTLVVEELDWRGGGIKCKIHNHTLNYELYSCNSIGLIATAATQKYHSLFTGFSVILEGLNRMRDLSHLRAIHRGSYFLDMKTVEPRRLTGEAWGETWLVYYSLHDVDKSSSYHACYVPIPYYM